MELFFCVFLAIRAHDAKEIPEAQEKFSRPG
jgi:hypothetical protein